MIINRIKSSLVGKDTLKVHGMSSDTLRYIDCCTRYYDEMNKIMTLYHGAMIFHQDCYICVVFLIIFLT